MSKAAPAAARTSRPKVVGSDTPDAAPSSSSAGPSAGRVSGSTRIVGRLLWTVGLILLVWSFGFTAMRASDLWWHVAIGERILDTANIPRQDPFSFTAAGRPMLIDSWLSDVSLAAWSDAFGLYSLVWWKWVALWLTFGWLGIVLLRLTREIGSAAGVPGMVPGVDDVGTPGDGSPVSSRRRRKRGPPRDPNGALAETARWLGVFIALWLGLAAAAPFLDIRPQLYTFLLYVALVWTLLGGRNRRWWAVPLFVLWANLHAGFVFGVVAVGVAAAATWIAGPREDRLRDSLLLVACAVACFMSPYGPETFLRPFRYAFDTGSPFRTIGEWLPPFAPGGIQSPVYPFTIFVWAVSTIGLIVSEPRRLRSRAFWICAGLGLLTLVMSLRSRRFVPLFSLSMTFLAAPAFVAVLHAIFARVASRWERSRSAAASGGAPTFRTRAVSWGLPIVAALVFLVRLQPYPLEAAAFHHITGEDTFPVDSVDFLQTNDIEGKIFAYYNWGGYLHLRTDGALRVFIDGRAGTVFSDQTYRDYVDVLSSYGPDWMDIVHDSDAELFLWPADKSQWRALANTHEWVPLHRDAVSTLLGRRAIFQSDTLSLPPPGPYRSLAQGTWLSYGGRMDEAEAAFRDAVERMPELGRGWFELAVMQYAQGREDEARATIRTCMEVFPHEGRSKAWHRLTGEMP